MNNMVLVAEDAVYHLTARQLDPASFYDYMTRGIDYKPAFCHHGDHGRFARVTTCHSCTKAETKMLGVVGVLTTPLTFTTPAIDFSDEDGEMYLHPAFGKRIGSGIPRKWTWDPAVAFPDDHLCLVFGICNSQAAVWLTRPKCPVYRLPVSNTFSDGRLCMTVPVFDETTSPFACLEQTLTALEGSPFNQDLPPDQELARNVFRYTLDDKGDAIQVPCKEGLQSWRMQRVSPPSATESILEELLRRWGIDVDAANDEVANETS